MERQFRKNASTLILEGVQILYLYKKNLDG